ncbi:MAG: autotransporter-associated beta strand repeat-containing protein [Thermoguttaceae bacterium]|nr:autotransporter-associated beta strand repeat-containing protein [Thermoguttaceae bacterium]
MKTTRTTVFLSLAILASFLFVASSAFADVTYTNLSIPSGDLITGTGEGGVGNVEFNISSGTTVTYPGAMSGAGNVKKTGSGELILTGNSSGYTGAVSVNTGTLTLSGSGGLNGSVSINNESIFKSAGRVTDLHINGGTFIIGETSETEGVYVADLTLSSGFIEFDVNTFISGATGGDLDLDYLTSNNCVLNNGTISLKFNNNDEMAWHDGAPNEGYSIIEVGETLVFNKDSIKVYADGQQTNNWYLVESGNVIYLKPKSSQPDDPPTVEKWYYANSTDDMGQSSWTMNDNPKIGVKFLDGDATAEFGTTSAPKTIAMNKSGSFTQGEYQIGEGHTLTINGTISGDADLLKTGAGTLVLYGNNTYTGETIVKQGTLTLGTASTGGAGTLKPGSIITVDGSDGTAILSGEGDVFAWAGNSPAEIRLINGGILQNDGDTSHSTIGAVIVMNNGIIQTKKEGATGTGGVGSYIIDNAIHVTGGQNNAINLNEFSIRELGGTTYPEGEKAGYFAIAEGAKLTINSKIDSYGGATNLPIVKTGKGELELTKRNENIKSDFIIKEGKVIGSAPNNGSSTFGYGTLTIEKDAILECHVSNQFGYGSTVQENITIRGTLIPSSYTHMHNVTLESGTIETEILTDGNNKSGLDFYNRTATITSSGNSVIKAQISKSGGTMTVNVTDGELTISGLNTSAVPFTKTGAGTLKLTNANTNTGGYDIQDGVVVAGNAVALGTGAVTIGSSDNAVGQLTIGETSNAALDLTVGGKVTLSGGQINFDFTADDFDTLIAANGFEFTTDTTGKFNLTFAQGTEATWYEMAPEAGYKIVSITNGYTGPEDLTSYLSGRTQPWTLTATADGIYLGQAEDPGSLYWNPIADDGKNWPIDGTEKIGVKYDEDDVKIASHEQNISLDSDGVFIIGDGYELDQVGPISGGGDLTKTEGGTLVLSGDNTYTGDTIVSGGTLELNKDNAIATSGSVTNNATIESTGDQTLNNLSGTNPEAEINADDGMLLLNNSAETQYKGTINGSAKVKKTGFGSLLFTGENSYTGGTEVDAGSLVLLTDEDSNGTAGVGPIEVKEDGELVYNVAAGQTKQIENAISGAGKITKTGAGKLQAHPTNDMPLQAGSLNVNQGQFDLLGEFEGTLNVGPLNEDGTVVGNEVVDAVFSPGNSVGDATVYGDVNIDAGATGLFEFSAYSNDPSARYFDTLAIEGNDYKFTINDEAAIKLSFLAGDADKWAEEGNEYHIVTDPGFADGDYNYLLANYKDFFDLIGQNGNGLYLIGRGAPETPGAPEPSTWALLLLGAAGLYWMKRQKKSK